MDYSGRQKTFQQTLVNEDLDGFLVTHAANLRYLCGYTGSNGLLLFPMVATRSKLMRK